MGFSSGGQLVAMEQYCFLYGYNAAMDMLSNMAVFARVVDAKSFSAAARRLNTSKSAVSKQVARLEAAFGERLLNRTTRQLSLTEAGAALYEHCVRIVAEAEAAELAVGRLHAAPRGILRVVAPAAFGHLHLAPGIPDFLSRYPDLELELTMSERSVDLAEEGIDLAICIAAAPAPTQIARALAPIRWVVCATPQYLAARGTPATPEALREHNCFSYTAHGGAGGPWHFATPAGKLDVRVEGNFRVNNGEAIREVVLEHHGIGLLPTFVVWRDLQSGALRRLLPECEAHGSFGSHIHAAYLPSRYVALKVRAFVDFFRTRFGAPPYWDA